MLPQYCPPACAQATGVQFGLPHTLGTFAPHVVPEAQVLPQSTLSPQPSPMTPQYVAAPSWQLVTAGVQPGGMQMCLVGSQNWPAGHAPQSSVCSQPSPTVPQYWPPVNAQVAGTQLGLPHNPVTLAPQVVPAAQLAPQSMEPLQPSPIVPQYVVLAPAWQLVTEGEHPGSTHRCLTVSHVKPAAQAPQSRSCPQPSPTTPQYEPPADVHVIGVQPGTPQSPGIPEPPHVSGATQVSPQATL
jgi:hypothetical protein